MRAILPNGVNTWAPYFDGTHYKDTYAVKSPIVFLKKLFSLPSQIAHFFLDLPTEFGDKDTVHAVLITVIKREKRKPLVFYLDSNNSILSDLRTSWIAPLALSKFLNVLDGAVAQS